MMADQQHYESQFGGSEKKILIFQTGLCCVLQAAAAQSLQS
jgi:hypothetical protein